MLRTFRRTDGPSLFPMMARYFPEEGELLGFRPEAFDRVVDRVFRWDARFFLGLLDLLHRPVVKFLVIEAEGRVVATAVVTFPHRAGYLSTVMVDEPYRGRGFAKRLVAAAEGESRRSGKRFLVLDVLRSNAPAISLYQKLGYRLLRAGSYRSKELSAGAPSTDAASPAVRPFRRRDGTPLARIALAQMPPLVSEALPTRAGDFRLTPAIALGLDSETQAWVVDHGRGAEAFVRATASATTVSGHLTSPLLDPAVPAASADALLRQATAWLSARGIRRAVCEVPDYHRPGLDALGRAGFTEAFGVDTFYRDLAP